MAGNAWRGNPVAVSDLASQILDPVLRRRAGMSVALVQSWEEIVGPRLAQKSRPEKIQWPRRGEDGPFEPAVLVIACEGIAALHVQHETSEIIARANAFLGFGAIGRVRIVQKPINIDLTPPKVPPRPLSEPERTRLEKMVSDVEDAGLRQSLERLGATVIGARSRPRG